MTREEYEASKARIEEHLRAGIELLEAACRQQMAALELVWAAGTQEPGTREAVEAPPVPRRRAGELYNEVARAILNVPEVFHRGHVCDQLGYQPDRGSLFRAFREMVEEGLLTIQSPGDNRSPTLYRRMYATLSNDG